MKSQIARNSIEICRNEIRQKFSPVVVPDLSGLQRLTKLDQTEVLSFLAERPVHTVVMTSMIQDNGIENEQNRGIFYGYRNDDDKFEGVALIGHTTLVEVRTDSALTALALQAGKSAKPIHVMMSDDDSIESFWRIYTGGTRQPRLVCAERLFEINFPVMVREQIPGLRLAVETELEQIAAAHAEVAFQESGVNPLETDRTGFLKRVLRRISQGRVWIVTDEDGKLIFKADIAAETAEVSYLEGIYVAPEKRGIGLAADCLSQLSRVLLEKVRYVCLLSNENFKQAHRAYAKAGFKSKDVCVTIFA